MRSIDIGVVRLSERLLQHDPPTIEEIQQAREWIRNETKKAWWLCRNEPALHSSVRLEPSPHWRLWRSNCRLIEPARIHNYRLTLETIADLEQQLLSRTKAARVGMPGLEKNREDVIASGAIILRTIMETLDEQECLVSDLGLREGVLLDLARRLSQS